MAATTHVSSSSCLVLQGVAAAASALGSSHSSVHGSSSLSVKQLMPMLAAAPKGAFGVCCKAEEAEQTATDSTMNVPSLPRRLALALLAGSATASLDRIAAPAIAAYGEAANVFGSPKQQSGFTSYAGSGFKLDIPSKWNPSKESEFPGTVLRYEDNFDAKSNLSVTITPTEKSSITEFGSPQKFLESVSYLLGKQAYAGNTISEGGFIRNAVAAAALLTAAEKEIDGKKYYNLDILTRTADGDEGGTHQLIVGTVADGKLYLLKAQAGDKRWFKGAQKFVKGVADSFSVA